MNSIRGDNKMDTIIQNAKSSIQMGVEDFLFYHYILPIPFAIPQVNHAVHINNRPVRRLINVFRLFIIDTRLRRWYG